MEPRRRIARSRPDQTTRAPADAPGARRPPASDAPLGSRETRAILSFSAPGPPRRPRDRLVAATIAAGIAAGAAGVVIGGDPPAPQFGAIAERGQPVVSRYLDIEANKARSMRALYIVGQRAIQAPRYDDIEANKARSRGSR